LKYKHIRLSKAEVVVFIWVKIGLLIKIISVNKDLARHSACRNDAMAKSKSVA
jgi:hypothetical protein